MPSLNRFLHVLFKKSFFQSRIDNRSQKKLTTFESFVPVARKDPLNVHDSDLIESLLILNNYQTANFVKTNYKHLKSKPLPFFYAKNFKIA